MWSEAIKILKGEYAVRAIREHKMDQAIIFCRTKIDCDNLEQYFMQQGGGEVSLRVVSCAYPLSWSDINLRLMQPGMRTEWKAATRRCVC